MLICHIVATTMAQQVGFGVEMLIRTEYTEYTGHADTNPQLVKRTYQTRFQEFRKQFCWGHIQELPCFSIWILETRTKIVTSTRWSRPNVTPAEVLRLHNITFTDWGPSNEYVVELS